MSDLDRSMHRSLWVWAAHSSFIERSHITKNMASEKKLAITTHCSLFGPLSHHARKKFYNIGLTIIKLFLPLKFANGLNELKCMSLTGFSKPGLIFASKARA